MDPDLIDCIVDYGYSKPPMPLAKKTKPAPPYHADYVMVDPFFPTIKKVHS
jgi:hypothetical protein